MSEQAIVEKIISDAEAEAQAIISDAEKKAEETVDKANLWAATARLDCAKIMLAEKRAVIDEVYARALEQLKNLGKADAVHLFERLLTLYAEEGDEVVFADGFSYAQDVAKLGVIKEKKLKVSPKKANIDGGCILIGKNSDKDLSFTALLAVDREERQAEIASALFN